MKLKLIHVVILGLIVFLVFLIINYMSFFATSKKNVPNKSSEELGYIAIGDSYTIGQGINEEDRWPNVLTRHLQEKGIKINLLANPAVSGYTVRDAIEIELPVVEMIKPDFVTVLIGANDNFIERSEDDYRADLAELLNKLQPMLSNPKNIILVTIPDYSKSPALQEGAAEGLSDFIARYNEIIKEEAGKRDLPVADIFPVSQTMTGSDDYTPDDLHPSVQGYAKWEKVIFPVVFEFFKERA